MPTNPKLPTVMVALPNQQWLHREVVIRLLGILSDKRVEFVGSPYMPCFTPIENARARITLRALHYNADFLLMIDDDNPPQNNPIDLVGLDLDVVGCPTPVWHNDGSPGRSWYFNAMRSVDGGWKEHTPREGLQEVDAVGTGCILIANRVLRSLIFKQPWMRVWDSQGLVDQGSDYAFCRRAKEAGYKIWAHYDYPCEHYTGNGLLETLTSQYEEQPDGPPWSVDMAITDQDEQVIASIVAKYKVKTVLEFGMGRSTMLFRKLGLSVTTIEHNATYGGMVSSYLEDQGLGEQKDQLKWYGSIKSLEKQRGHEPFDLAFVDGPIGKPHLSRLDSCRLASLCCDRWLIHDSHRPGEAETMAVFAQEGWRVTHLVGTPRGLTLVEKVRVHNNVPAIDPPESKKESATVLQGK